MHANDYAHLTITQKENVTVITIDRPDKRNALSPDVLKELTKAFTTIPSDHQTRVIVLTGGEKYFSAGFDLNEIRKL